MAHENPNFDAFIERVKDLEIDISKSSDGVFTACTHQEPFFCYDADAPEALNALVIDTLASYARHFYGIQDIGVRTEKAPLPAPTPTLPVEVTRPVSRLKAIFDEAA